jgi:hypothetical protein
MSTPLLFNVLFAWKCSSTHHKLALDALRHLKCDHAEQWMHLFLTHIEPYLAGSKAPDNQFKDFKNHVLHVEQNEWGGAISAAENWYEKTKAALTARRWKEAVYNAGVLSHYYSDPWQPFHTGQTEAEGIVHRAAEWSIACAYPELQSILETRSGYPEVSVPTGSDWLAQMVRHAARTSHLQYQVSIDHYDLAKGKKDPPTGLDQELKDRIAVLLGSAVIGYARILDRLIAEADVTPPSSPVTLLGVLALLTVPIFWVTKKLKDAKERAVIEAIFKEVKATGKVIANLPEDEKAVRTLHAAEVLQVPLEQLDAQPPGPVGQAYGTGAAARPFSPRSRPQAAKTSDRATTAKSKNVNSDKPRVSEGSRSPAIPNKFYLSQPDHVERAPSIGPKTAAALGVAGIKTVGQLLSGDAATIAAKTRQKQITREMVVGWQQQARLMCQIPGTRGHDVQLLVACDVADVETLALSSPNELHTRLSTYAATPAGQRALRDCQPPTLEEVQRWVNSALSLATAPQAA